MSPPPGHTSWEDSFDRAGLLAQVLCFSRRSEALMGYCAAPAYMVAMPACITTVGDVCELQPCEHVSGLCRHIYDMLTCIVGVLEDSMYLAIHA